MRIINNISDADDEEWLKESFENELQLKLYKAYKEARRGKRGTMDERRFEVNADANLKTLREQIINRTYRPSRSTAHIIHKPVMREIFAAPFPDRVVHHVIYDEVMPWWDKHFLYDSYSCREGKGTLFGIKRLDHHIRQVSHNYARPVYIIKMDVQGYFMSLPRDGLFKQAMWGLDRQFAHDLSSPMYKTLKFLWQQVIFDNPVEGVTRKGRLSDWDLLPKNKSLFNQPPRVGIVIGNLTSQLLSNVYLDLLDRFIVYKLGYKHSGRYVDDFYIVVREDELEQAKRDIEVIREFLKLHKLTLHPTKTLITTPEKGVPFLGAMVYRDHILPGKRLRKNFRQACVEVQAGEKEIETLVSYLGHVKHFDKIRFLEKELDRIGLEYYC